MWLTFNLGIVEAQIASMVVVRGNAVATAVTHLC